MKKRSMWGLLIAGALIMTLSGCNSKDTVNIVVTDNSFDSQKIHNAIAKIVVEQAYEGYTLEESTASSTMNWQSIIAGEVDLDIDSWTQNVASYVEDKAKGVIVDVGVLIPDSKQGLYVPRYVIEGDAERGIEPMAPQLKTVEDLKKYPDIFPDDEKPSMGRIYGSIPGWMADEILYKKYEHYGLDEQFTYTRLGSEGALFASLSAAYNLGEAWVGYCYEPTWVTGKLDLVLLEDAPYELELYLEGQCEFPQEEIKIVSSNQFAQKAPELLEFFKNYKTGSILVSQALAYLDETKGSYEEAAIWFLQQNDDLINQWLPEKNAKALRSFLDKQ